MPLMLAFLAVYASSADAESVLMEGTLDTEQPGMVRLELLIPQQPGQNPLLAWSGWAEAPGMFSFEVPKKLGEVKLRAALDLKRDGIGPDDPQIRVPMSLNIEERPIRGLVLRIRPPEHRAPALPEPSLERPPVRAR